MSKYIITFVGLLVLIMIPEFASMLQVVVQSFVGLGIFAVGAISIIDEKSN
jgi:hypothetical protein